MSKVSVVIPTYNRAEFLRSAISSVLKQTYKDFEIIVVDDASSDHTSKVVNGFNCEGMRYIRHRSNKGEAQARNTGMLNASGDYIAFLDDDDEWLPEKLAAQVRILDNSPEELGLVYSGYFILDVNSRKALGQRNPSKRGYIYESILRGNLIGSPSTVVLRRKCLDKVGMFDQNISYGLDHDLWIRISRYYRFEYVDKPLVKYHIHPSRLSTNPEIKAKGIVDMINKYGKRVILENRYYRNSFLSIGIEFCEKGSMVEGRKMLLKAIRYNPRRIHSYFYFLISLLNHHNFLKLKRWKEHAIGHIRKSLERGLS